MELGLKDINLNLDADCVLRFFTVSLEKGVESYCNVALCKSSFEST